MLSTKPVRSTIARTAAADAEPFACGFHAEGRGAAWVTARGELDLVSAPQFAQTLEQALQRALLAVVDLRQLTFIDSTGIGVIVAADARVRETGHRLLLIRESGPVGRLFAPVGLTERLRVVDLTPEHPAAETCHAPEVGTVGAVAQPGPGPSTSPRRQRALTSVMSTR